MKNEPNITYEISKVKEQIERAKKRLYILEGKLEGFLQVVGLIQDEKMRKKEQERQIDEL